MKGQSLEKALIQGKEYAKQINAAFVFAYDSTFIKSADLRSNTELTIDGVPLRELVSEEMLNRFLIEGSNIEEAKPEVKHTREELIKIFKWSNDLLRKEGLRNLDRFIEFSNILFIKIISEIEADREQRGLPRRLPEELCWESFCSEQNPKKMLNYINNSVLRDGLADKYNHTDDVFRKKLQIENPDTVQAIVRKLSSLTLLNTESEIKGDAFEYFLKSLASGNDLGEYFTPRHIVSMMVKIINPKPGETILDPFCGTGGFLIESFRSLRRSVNEKDEKMMELIKEKSIFGIELTDTYKIAKMNMIITGDGHNNIVCTDTAKRDYWQKFIENSEDDKSKIKYLESLRKIGFHIVLANIPYSQTTDYGLQYAIPSTNGDSVFIQEIIMSLANNGRCAVIVPEGFLFRRELRSTRKYLLENCSVDAIISLPSGVFMPYTGVKTDVLVFTKGKRTKEIWYFNIENDGLELNANRRKIEGKNDIDLLLETWEERKITKNSWFVNVNEIIDNDFNMLSSKKRKNMIPDISVESSKKLIDEAIKKEEEISKKLLELKKMIQ